MKIPVLEIFGPTIQGEGMVIGQKLCSFERQAVIIPVHGVIQNLPGTGRKKKKSG